jgi:Tol biopolymer transport system component
MMRGTLGILGLTLVVSLGTAASASATFPGSNGLFASREYERGVFTVAPDGSGEHYLGTKSFARPQWSPRGKRLLVADEGVYAVDASGANRKAVVDRSRMPNSGEAFDVTWGPHARRVAFDVLWQSEPFDEDDVGVGHMAVYTATAHGKHVRKLHSGQYPAWSPRGGRIALSVGSRGCNCNDCTCDSVALIRPNGRGFHRVYTSTTGQAVAGLDFSPDGRRLLWRERRGPRYVIRAMKLSSRKVRTVQLPAADDVMDAVWAPSGDRIAYLASRFDGAVSSNAFFTVRASGRRRHELFRLPGSQSSGRNPTALAWQPQP